MTAGLTIPQTCRELNASKATVYAEINAGKLRSYTVGRRRYVSRDALADFIREREKAAVLPKDLPSLHRKADRNTTRRAAS